MLNTYHYFVDEKLGLIRVEHFHELSREVPPGRSPFFTAERWRGGWAPETVSLLDLNPDNYIGTGELTKSLYSPEKLKSYALEKRIEKRLASMEEQITQLEEKLNKVKIDSV
jgi:hypothetical protein